MDLTRRFPLPGQNRLLSALPCELQLTLLAHMEKVSLPAQRQLYEARSPIHHVHFPLGGSVSLVLQPRTGPAVEVATVGNEGLVGAPAFFGDYASRATALVQIPGQALAMRAEDFRRALQQHGEFRAVVGRYVHCLLEQLVRASACQRTHSLRARLCRALLATHDRVAAEEFALTQELLARMLGVRRPSVSVAAHELQREGYIRYRRGWIRVLDRAGLEALACECHDVQRAPAAAAPGPLMAA